MGLGWGILQRLSNSFGVVSLNTLIQIVLCFIIIICASGAVLSHAAIRAQALRRHHPKMWGRRRPGGCDGVTPGVQKIGKNHFGTSSGTFWDILSCCCFYLFWLFFFAFLGLKMKKIVIFQPKMEKSPFFCPKPEEKYRKFSEKGRKMEKKYWKKSKWKLICFRKKKNRNGIRKISKIIENNTRKDAI